LSGEVSVVERSARDRVDGQVPVLVAPAAVRVFDLEMPLPDLRLGRSRLGGPYRSLLVVVRFGGDPLGAAVVAVERAGWVSRQHIALELQRQLETELTAALVSSGLELPRQLTEGIGPPPGCRRPQARLCSVSVVVSTRHKPHVLRHCLRSILHSDYDDFEVIVVENRPRSPDTRLMLAEQFGDDSRVRYAEEPGPGRASARNTGLALADGELVGFTDDDVIVDSGWIRRSAEAFDGGEDVACVTGLMLPLELETEAELRLEHFTTLAKGFSRQSYHLPDARCEYPLLQSTAGLIGSGANPVLRADVVNRLGGFHARLGPGTPAIGGEDLDLYIRLLQAGHTVAYEPSAIAWQDHASGTAEARRHAYRYGMGLSAALTKQLVAGPDRRALLRAARGLADRPDTTSRRNANNAAAYPRHHQLLARLGMLVGPAAYVTSLIQPTRGSSASESLDHYVLDKEHLLRPNRESVRLVQVHPRPARTRARVTMGPIERPLAAVAVVACVAAPAAVALGPPPALKLVAVLSLLCLAPGAALISLLSRRMEFGLVLGVSLGATALLAQSMLWLGLWQPTAYVYGVAAVCLPVLGARLYLSTRRPLRTPTEPAQGTVARMSRSAAGHAGLLAAALGAWVVSVEGADVNRMAGLGLLDAMPPSYFVAFALLLVGFAAAVTRRELHPGVLALYVLGLLLVLYGTIPLVYEEPRLAFSYKHFGVIELISATGSVNRNIDIYNNWPGFFAANAWLSSAAGVPPVAYAGCSQLFFGVANVAAVQFALRGIIADERTLWIATWLFVLGNWVQPRAEDLAPQAFGFVLSLVVLGLCLRSGRAATSSEARLGHRPPRWLRRFATRVPLRRAPDDQLPGVPLGPRGALMAGGLCFLAVVVSHQLSPIMLILSVLAFALATRLLPLWIPAAMIAIEVWWVALAWPFVSSRFGLIEPGLPGAAPPRSGGAALPGAVLGFYAPAAVVAIVALLALIGAVRRLRSGKWDVVPAVFVLAIPLVAAVQSYGGNGVYRVFLFALPWLAFFGAAAFADESSSVRRSHARFIPVTVATSALGVCLLVAVFGLDLGYRITRDEVRAETWTEQHAPRGTQILHATDGPEFLTARYRLLVSAESLLWRPAFRKHPLGPADVPRLEALATRLRGSGGVFVVLSRRQENEGRVNGTLPKGAITRFARALSTSPSFRLRYQLPTAWVYQYFPPSPD
jgi:GT2 family glycosyltransferase